MKCIKATTCSDAWETSIVELLYGGSTYYYASTEGPCHEISDLVIEVNNPDREPRMSSKYSFAQLTPAVASLPSQSSRNVDTIYRRLHSWINGRERIDQVELALWQLKRDPTSRRAVLSIWDARRDPSSDHPMTPLSMSVRVKSNRLVSSLVTRSNDAWVAAAADIAAFAALHCDLAARLSLEPGALVYHAISYHLYEFDVPAARRAFPRE